MRIDEAGGEDAAGGIEEFGAGELREKFFWRCRRV
jgi:hypothetical protein